MNGPGSALRLAVQVAAVGWVLATPLLASDWPRFRGPNGTGVSPGRELPGEIDPDANALWSVHSPRGHHSPIVVGGRLFLTGHEGDERLTLCYDATTGKEIWRRAVTRAREETFHRLNGPTTPTPATDGRGVFVRTEETLRCFRNPGR